MFKKINLSFLFFFFCLCLKTQAFEVPALTGPVVDQVNLLSARTKQAIEQTLYQARQNNGPQVQVLILSSLQGEGIEQVAIKVFDQWKLGDKKINNGVLFIIAPTEKKLRIEVGRGLEGNIPDAIAKRIVADTVRPYFKRGDFNMGVAQGVSAILHYAGSDSQIPQGDVQTEAPPQEEGHTNYLFLIIAGIWILIFIFNPSLALAFLFSGRGGGSGSSGGWSGGGGNSAGGGASGDW